MLADIHDRLSGVIIEQLPYDRFIERYDRPGALFFLDPPYLDCEDDYGEGVFERADYDRLRTLLGALKGRFIMTLNDRPEVRSIFAGFDIETVELSYRISGRATAAREVIISSP